MASSNSVRIAQILFTSFLFWGCAHTTPKKSELADLRMQMGISFIQKENYPSALQELLIAEEYDPSNPLIHTNLAFVYFMRDRIDLAETHYKKAIALKPDFTDAKNNLARLYIENGKYNLAIPLLNEALKDLTYNDYPKIYENLGVLEFKRNRYTNAKIYFRKALESNQNNCANRLFLGRSLLELKDLPQATLELNKSVSACKNLGLDDAHFYSAIALFRNKQRESAMLRFEEMIKLYPNGKNTPQAKRMLDYIRKGTL